MASPAARRARMDSTASASLVSMWSWTASSARSGPATASIKASTAITGNTGFVMCRFTGSARRSYPSFSWLIP